MSERESARAGPRRDAQIALAPSRAYDAEAPLSRAIRLSRVSLATRYADAHYNLGLLYELRRNDRKGADAFYAEVGGSPARSLERRETRRRDARAPRRSGMKLGPFSSLALSLLSQARRLDPRIQARSVGGRARDGGVVPPEAVVSADKVARAAAGSKRRRG